MNFTLFMVFSTIEGLSLFTITLTIFRYNILNYWRQGLFINIILALLSFFFREQLGMGDLAPLLLLLITISYICLVLEIDIFHSALMSVTGFLSYLMIQTLFVYLLAFSGFFSIGTIISPFSYQGFSLQGLSSLFIFVFSYLIYKKGWGFSFSFGTLKLHGNNLIYLIIILLCLSSIGLIFFFFFNGFINLYLFILILLAGLLSLLILLFKKEKRYD